MTKYRARSCPKCNYYIGFSISKPIVKTSEFSVTSFCLNCGYKLPVHAVLQGTGRVSSLMRRRWLRIADSLSTGGGAGSGTSTDQTGSKSQGTPIRPEDYSRHLRAIGQQLETLNFATFNLECTGTSYLIWTRADATARGDRSLSHLRYGRIQNWLRIGDRVQRSEQEDESGSPATRGTASIGYSPQDVERMDDLGKNQRFQTNGLTDGHSLSQLLRTMGALVSQRNHRLLGISWRDLSICIVVETAQGKREIDVFRPDNLYDLWVRMYLRRENRALSDVPY